MHVDYNSKSVLQPYLEPNEKLHWVGQPKKGIVFRTSDIFLIPFSILWCGFAIFWLATALRSGAPIPFVLFGVPFVLVGLVFVFGRFLIDARQRANTWYGITDNRILILSGVFKRTVRSIQIKTLSEMEYSEKKDGSGTILIGSKNPMMLWANGMNWWPGVKLPPALDMIPDVRMVYQKITGLQQQHD